MMKTVDKVLFVFGRLTFFRMAVVSVVMLVLEVIFAYVMIEQRNDSFFDLLTVPFAILVLFFMVLLTLPFLCGSLITGVVYNLGMHYHKTGVTASVALFYLIISTLINIFFFLVFGFTEFFHILSLYLLDRRYNV